MIYRLRNERDPERTLMLAQGAWYGTLDLAEEFGWNPMGTTVPGGWHEAGFALAWGEPPDHLFWRGGYTPQEDCLVLLEDALNLADALDRAFLDYEPRYVDWVTGIFGNGGLERWERYQPGVGTILLLIDFCRNGAFTIERA